MKERKSLSFISTDMYVSQENNSYKLQITLYWTSTQTNYESQGQISTSKPTDSIISMHGEWHQMNTCLKIKVMLLLRVMINDIFMW